MAQAIFAAGCFWGVQHYYDQMPGVTSSVVGYTGGHTENPTYEQVCSHTTGHAEAVLLDFDPAVVTYEMLCRHFFQMHDPTQLNRQGWDIGDNYRSAIFYFDEDQHEVAENVKREYEPKFDKAIVTEISPTGTFYPAEAYHQKYAERTGHGMCNVPYASLN